MIYHVGYEELSTITCSTEQFPLDHKMDMRISDANDWGDVNLTYA